MKKSLLLYCLLAISPIATMIQEPAQEQKKSLDVPTLKFLCAMAVYNYAISISSNYLPAELETYYKKTQQYTAAIKNKKKLIILSAIMNKEHEIIPDLIAYRIDPNEQVFYKHDYSFANAILAAVEQNYIEGVEILLRYKVDVSRQMRYCYCDSDSCPLNYLKAIDLAYVKQHLECFELMLKNGYSLFGESQGINAYYLKDLEEYPHLKVFVQKYDKKYAELVKK